MAEAIHYFKKDMWEELVSELEFIMFYFLVAFWFLFFAKFRIVRLLGPLDYATASYSTFLDFVHFTSSLGSELGPIGSRGSLIIIYPEEPSLSQPSVEKLPFESNILVSSCSARISDTSEGIKLKVIP